MIHRSEIAELAALGISLPQTWQIIDQFEREVADFFGAPWAVATDCCTHALELCLRMLQWKVPLMLPTHTYMSVPMMLTKLAIPWRFTNYAWQGSYDVIPGHLVDAATLWQKSGYRPGTMMCVSFQFKKHICIGRGGMILLDRRDQYETLLRMRHDGRDPTLDQWCQDVHHLGYHYNMTPEDAARGLMLLRKLGHEPARVWTWQDYRDLRELSVFQEIKYVES